MWSAASPTTERTITTRAVIATVATCSQKPARVTQQEFYIGEPGKDADRPITVKRGERIRMYVMNAGPSIWSAFHVIGTVFDRTVIEASPGATPRP